MFQSLLISFSLIITSLWSISALSHRCGKAIKYIATVDYSNNPLVIRLNSRLSDSAYKVILLGRHGKASQENKFTSAERQADPAKVQLDIRRPLKTKGKRAAFRLADLMRQLAFRSVGMWGSHALRVKETARPTRKNLGDRVKIKEFDQGLYYANVPKEMQARLTSSQAEVIPHAFFWGHGKTTFALFKQLTGASEGFLPTAAVMIVALKAETWGQVFEGRSQQIEAYAWSPNKSHRVKEEQIPVASLESLQEGVALEGGRMMLESMKGGLESLESAPPINRPNSVLDRVKEDFDQGFEFTILR